MKHLRPVETVTYLKEIHGIETTEGTLSVWRCQGKGPRAFKLNGKIYYRDADLDHYVGTAKVLKTMESWPEAEIEQR